MSPIYKNITGGLRFISGKRVQPGQSVETLVWTRDSSFRKVEDFPMVNNTLASEKLLAVNGEACVIIPETNNIGEKVTRYQVHINVQCGEPVVYINSKKNEPPLLLYPEARWNIRSPNRTIERVIVTWNTEIGEMFLIVEEI